MKILKPNSVEVQITRQGILQNYWLVKDSAIHPDTTNYTSYATLLIFLDVFRIDYIQFRESLKTHVLPNWGSLDIEEKKNLIREMIYPTNAVLTDYFSESELKTLWSAMAERHKIARINRWEKARKELSYYLTVAEAFQFYQDTKEFKGDYIDANIPILKLWALGGNDSSLGIDYTTNGFPSKTYFSVALQEILLNALNGEV
ncbi:MAG: hypothetical protein L6Q54_11625 [Leptospiraceae bacterium]|nr:hypothetical protein [Leptospiraceae bacterium]